MTTMRADDLLVETINTLLADQCTPERIAAAEGSLDADLWTLLYDNGLAAVGVDEAQGGSGGSLHDYAAILIAAGEHAAPVPLGDTLLASHFCAASGLVIPSGPTALAIERAGRDTIRVPWGGVATSVVVVTEAGVGLTTPSALTITGRGENYPGEPWIDITLASATAATGTSSVHVTPRVALFSAALMRSALIAGALQRAVDLCVQYAMEREQFGKPIGKFQALQHYLAEMAGEAAAARAAVDTAVDIVVTGGSIDDCENTAAAAKAYAGRAVATVTRLSHQLHGAIGYTDEHRLQYSTRRLWAWRDEFGSEAEWAAVVGRSIINAGGPALWPTVTRWPAAVR
jgi:acyl-CoA dehydrogenase